MTSPSRFLITGGGGFVCRNVALALLESGMQVMLVDRVFDVAQRAELARWGSQVMLVEADAARLPDFDADVLIHGAAVTAGPEERHETPEANLRANIDPALAALEWAQDHAVGRVILISSSGIFSESAPGELTESSTPSPVGTYALAKHVFEQYALTLRTRYRRDVIAVRLGDVFGPGELPRPTRPRISMIGQMIADALAVGQITVPLARPARDWTFAPDLGRALLALSSASRLSSAVYQVTSANLVSPLAAAYAVQAAVPIARLIVDETPIPNQRRFGHMTNDLLRNEVGFDQWTPLPDGVARAVEWMRATTETTS